MISLSFQFSSALALLFVVGAAIEFLRERSGRNALSRGMALLTGFLGTAVVIDRIVTTRVNHHIFTEPGVPLLSTHSQGYLSQLSLTAVDACSLISLAIFLVGALLAPTRPLVRVRMSRILLLQAALLLLINEESVSAFLLTTIATLLLMSTSMRFHSHSLQADVHGELRASLFTKYHAVSIAFLALSLALRTLDATGILPHTSALLFLDTVSLTVASAIIVGLFPFHGWVLPFLSAPRSTIFLPMTMIQVGMLFFFRVYSPILATLHTEAPGLLLIPLAGLLYAAVLFFAERRLKRIPGNLYLSHISLMALSVGGLGHMGVAASLLDGVNVLFTLLGLLGVCSLLTARWGVRGVLSPTGLAQNFPELGVCFLICALSLVGFPGTIGFIDEEVLLGQGVDVNLLFVGTVALALTLNGFTSFRLFARVFYGSVAESPDRELQLSIREKGVLYAIVAFIILNGVAPSLLVSSLTDVAR